MPLQVIPGLPLEKDELHSDSELYKELKELKHAASEVEAEIQRRRRLKSASKGLEPAYIDTDDLIIIIEDLLLTKSPVSKAFQRHEVNDKKCAEWAKRTIKYSVEKHKLTQAINCLANNISAAELRQMHMYGIPLNNRNNTSLLLIKKHCVLDIKSIVNSVSYPAAWRKMKKQLDIATRLQDKDDQLAVKDKTISDKDSEIERLETELLRNKSEDWKHEAIKLKMSGVSVTEIANRLGKSRTTISTYLNKPDIKLLISGSN